MTVWAINGLFLQQNITQDRKSFNSQLLIWLNEKFLKAYDLFLFSEKNWNDISMETSKKNPEWVELKGKIWTKLTTKDDINEAPLTWSSCLGKIEQLKIKNFPRAVQSKNAIFAGFNKHMKLSCFFNLYVNCYLGLIFKRNL